MSFSSEHQRRVPPGDLFDRQHRGECSDDQRRSGDFDQRLAADPQCQIQKLPQQIINTMTSSAKATAPAVLNPKSGMTTSATSGKLQSHTAKLVLHQPSITFAERALHGEQLPEDRVAIGIGFDHSSDGAQLALGATQPVHKVGSREVAEEMGPAVKRHRQQEEGKAPQGGRLQSFADSAARD